MRATVTLINALRKAAGEMPHNYQWCLSEKCNCGLLVKHLGVPLGGLSLWRVGVWSLATKTKCASTGEPMRHIFAMLNAAGLSDDDILDIECCGSASVIARIGNGREFGIEPYANAEYVIAYFRAQADMLEESLGDNFELRPITLTPAKEPVSA